MSSDTTEQADSTDDIERVNSTVEETSDRQNNDRQNNDRQSTVPRRTRTPPTVDQINATLIILLSAIVVVKLRLDLIVQSTTPTGGDNGGHVWTADYVRREMLPHLRFTGWSNDWFGGVPVLGFYFPAPTWLIVALSFLLPYGVAYKIVTILGIASLPWVCYRLGKRFGLHPTRSLFIGLSAFPFLFARHFRILGGNILSTMAGEFSFSISLSLAVFYAGLMVEVLRTGRRRSLAAVVLALTGLSHIVPTIFALAFTVAATVVELRRKEIRRQLTDVVIVGSVGALLAGFWLIPFARNLPYSNSMDYERYTRFIKTLFPFSSDSSSLQTPKDGMFAACAALLLGGLAVIVGWMRRDRFIMTMSLTMAIVGVAFRLAPQGAMWNIRLLPLWFFCAYVLAGQTLAGVIRVTLQPKTEEVRLTRLAAPAFAGSALFLISCGTAMQALPPFLPVPMFSNTKTGITFEVGRLGDTQEYRVAPKPFGWASSNAQGAEKKSGWPEYKRLLQALKPLPCGRALWEPDKSFTKYGSTMALMQLPYWTKSCIQSSEGLYFEASATAPFHWLTTALVSEKSSNPQRRLPYPKFDLARGVDRMRQLGIRYYLPHTDLTKKAAAANPELRLVAKSSPFEIYEIANNAVVTALRTEPVVVTGIGSGLEDGFIDVGIAQWMDTESAFPTTLVTDGPPDWIRRKATIQHPPSTVNQVSKSVIRPKRGLGVSLDQPTSANSSAQAGANPTPRSPASTASSAATSTATPTSTATSTSTSTATSADVNARELAPVVVSKVKVDPTKVRFHVDRIGVPVLVRISWFPNWKVSGGSGPYRAMPNYIVVIPTRNDVELNFGKTTADHLGALASVCGVIGVVALRRKRRPTSATPGEESTTASQALAGTEEFDEESAFERVESPQS